MPTNASLRIEDMPKDTPAPEAPAPRPSLRRELAASFARIEEIERAMGVKPIRGVVGPRFAY